MPLLSIMSNACCKNPSPVFLSSTKGYNVKDRENLRGHPAETRNVECKTKSSFKVHQAAKSFVISPLVAALVALSPLCHPPLSRRSEVVITKDSHRGADLFNKACIGCHYAGGNIIQPGATLFLKDLQRNGVNSEEEIYRVTYYECLASERNAHHGDNAHLGHGFKMKRLRC
ncbi:uncharacterized protein LOC113289992 [Papaver somniferum]|uniref:uncharacterized protein LOC113289992 n=1 Tax=Papaver somniferum TaxID=3469 RepID=UPI000E6F747C|nr:uncharacterized protein LOC113289992 [Papaver somniferum]